MRPGMKELLVDENVIASSENEEELVTKAYDVLQDIGIMAMYNTDGHVCREAMTHEGQFRGWLGFEFDTENIVNTLPLRDYSDKAHCVCIRSKN